MSMKVYLLLTLAATTAATPLTCQKGAVTQADVCTTTTQYTEAEACTKEGHSCLTGKYAYGRSAAFGCYPDNALEAAKTAIIDGCKADPECVKYNPDGPVDGFTECKTDSCNECDTETNGAGTLVPSMALLAVTMLTIASGL
jgi:hypothetical protein